MKTRNKSRYSLHITISSLFVSLIIVFAILISWQNYRKTSEIIISTGNQVFDQINRELLLDLQGTRDSVTQAVDILALTPINSAGSLQERIQSLPILSIALRNEPQMSAIQVGYDNGDYFIIRPVNSEFVRDKFTAPLQSAFIVDHIDTDNQGRRQLLRLFFNQDLVEISRDKPVATQYDPRERPWYKLAQENSQVKATKPYLFYFFRKVGSTFTVETPVAGVVLAADILLDQLSQNLARFSLTPSTEVVLFGNDANALAYQDMERLIIREDNNQFKIAKLSQLGSEVLTFLSKDLKLENQSLNFSFHHQRWLGAVRKLKIAVGIDLYVLMVSPEKELLSKAISIRWQSVMITALILLATLPLVWLFARKISRPIRLLANEALLISHFNFSSPVNNPSMIREVDELSIAMKLMKDTISKFLSLINSLAGESNFASLLQRINLETMQISQADAAITYLLDDNGKTLHPSTLHDCQHGLMDVEEILSISLTDKNALAQAVTKNSSSLIPLNNNQPKQLQQLLKLLHAETGDMIAMPLRNREHDLIGILCLLYQHDDKDLLKNEQISFVQALSGFAAVSLESQRLLMMQKALLDSFIKLIAGAIDSKSPYTGGHCQRVPELTRLLAQAACDCKEPPFEQFQLNDKSWEALHIASWLHDCGKVTTPDYVVDKSTKLETIYDRLHEIRMRFEVLKRDAEIRYWQNIVAGEDQDDLKQNLSAEWRQLDQDFAFIAKCNEGGEFMLPENIVRLQKIAEYTWIRTLDDCIGLSWEEKQRKQKTPKKTLPTEEKILADKIDHLIEHDVNDQIPEDNPWGFHLQVPQYKYNRGELYNLQVSRGTLTKEERYKINDHIVQTIIMLEKLPYPKHLRDVPSIAGAHHEKMDGTGYPKQLTQQQMPLTARIMAIADIFEALTASDRPYKKANTLSESITIMATMSKQRHIDSDLFKLFLSSGAYLEYGKKYLQPEQIDNVDIAQYLTK
ncbi:MAG: HD domain-containing protein [Methylococcaceae bacterium]|nr:HD domain-containing protein [Methylococcaceae bacterium]